jgi:hypothetical protein
VLPAGSERDVRERDIGSELATLLAAARRLNGVVVRPPPVTRLDGRYDTEVDMAADAEHLADMHSLLAGLVEAGALNEATEATARTFFNMQDRGWPSPAPLRSDMPIFVDWLALTHLQTVGLFEVFLRTFRDVYVTDELKEDTASLGDFEEQTRDILATIDSIRGIVNRAYVSGKLLFGPYRKASDNEAEGNAAKSSTINLVTDLLNADMVIVDDRSLNKTIVATDNHGHRTRLGTSLDLIEDLTARAILSSTERRTLRHRLRAGGAVLVPLQAEEVLMAALRSGQSESAELRAIRESIGLTRIAEVPRFPAEIRWFASTSLAIQHALIQLWGREPDQTKAARMADWLLDLRPEPEDWVRRWEGTPPPEWCRAVQRVMTGGLCLPFEIESSEATAAYSDWLESRVFGPLRAKAPQTYQAVVEYIRGVILNSPGNGNGN